MQAVFNLLTKSLKTFKLIYKMNFAESLKWVRRPPTQEPVLPMLFSLKPSPLLWLSRKIHHDDLALCAQYFHPSYVTENTYKYWFFNRHSKLFPASSPPDWSEPPFATKCELYSYSRILRAQLDWAKEKSPAFSMAPRAKKSMMIGLGKFQMTIGEHKPIAAGTD